MKQNKNWHSVLACAFLLLAGEHLLIVSYKISIQKNHSTLSKDRLHRARNAIVSAFQQDNAVSRKDVAVRQWYLICYQEPKKNQKDSDSTNSRQSKQIALKSEKRPYKT